MLRAYFRSQFPAARTGPTDAWPVSASRAGIIVESGSSEVIFHIPELTQLFELGALKVTCNESGYAIAESHGDFQGFDYLDPVSRGGALAYDEASRQLMFRGDAGNSLLGVRGQGSTAVLITPSGDYSQRLFLFPGGEYLIDAGDRLVLSSPNIANVFRVRDRGNLRDVSVGGDPGRKVMTRAELSSGPLVRDSKVEPAAVPNRSPQDVRCLAISEDGRYGFVLFDDGAGGLWDLRASAMLRELALRREDSLP